MSLEVENRIKSVIAEVLHVDPNDIHDASSPRSIPSWKGINHREIVSALEREFDLSFDVGEIETFVNYKIIKSTILAYID